MEDFPLEHRLHLISTDIKVLMETGKLKLRELQKQTMIVEQTRDFLLSTLSLSQGTQPGTKRKKELPVVLSTKQIAQVLNISLSYAPAKVRALRRQLQLKKDELFTVSLFCQVTRIPRHEVMRALGFA